MKKLISLLLCLAMAAALAACGGSGTNPAAATKAADVTQAAQTTENADRYAVTEPITIEFWNVYPEESKTNWLQSCVDAFNASQDLITVVQKNISSYNPMNEQLSAAQAAGKGLPALALINCPRVLTYADGGMTEPLDAYMAAYGFEVDDYNKGMMDAMVPIGSTEHYGIPWGISSAVAYWNMDLLRQAGIDKVPETWAEVREVASTIKEKTGAKTIGFPSELNYCEVLMRNAGADPLGDGTKADLFNENIVRFMKEYKEMIDAGEAEFFVGNDRDTNLNNSFYSGQMACIINTSSVAHSIAQSADFEIATAFAIKDVADPAISCIAGSALIMPALNSQQVKNAGFQFLMYMTSRENVSSWSSVGAVYPTRLSTLENGEVMKEIYEYEPLLENIYKGLDDIVPKNKTPYQGAAYKVLLDAMGDYFYNGADFDTVWSGAEKEINYILAGG